MTPPDRAPEPLSDELQSHLRRADEAASTAHNYRRLLRGDDLAEFDRAIWTIHDTLRPLLDAARDSRPVVTHGRHCPCSACKRQDWAEPGLAPCGMHGPSCPPVYAPIRDSRPVGEGLDAAIERLADGYLSAISANATGRFRRDVADLRARFALTDQPASTEADPVAVGGGPGR